MHLLHRIKITKAYLTLLDCIVTDKLQKNVTPVLKFIWNSRMTSSLDFSRL